MSDLFHVQEERHKPHAVYQLWQSARDKAVSRDRLPVVVVTGPEWSGRLVVVHEADLAALSGQTLDQVMGF